MAGPAVALPIRAERVTVAAGAPLLDRTGWTKDPPPGEVLAIRAAGGVVGFVALSSDGDERTIEAIWVDPARRRAGLGVEAAFAVCDALRAGGQTRRVRAWVPSDVGLLVYFWLRVGFAPVRGSATDQGMFVSRRL